MKESIQPQTNANALLSRKQRWRRWATRRWLFPALYLTTAAAVLSVMWFYDQSTTPVQPASQVAMTNSGSTNGQWHPEGHEEAVAPAALTGDGRANPATASEKETLQWPVANREDVQIVMPFYSHKAQQPAMVTYQDTVRPHVGIDLAREDQQPFEVRAAMSGKVKLVLNDPLAGGVIEVEHSEGLSTIYQSVGEVSVKVGQDVRQGEMIGQSGRSELEKKQGVHLHFEVRKNGEPVDPSNELKTVE